MSRSKLLPFPIRDVEPKPLPGTTKPEKFVIVGWQYLDQFKNWVGARNEHHARSWASTLETDYRAIYAKSSTQDAVK
ncbi:hypothetical protein JRX38_02410 [Gluconobacter cerinus]|uniref:hypothetical protein n=1 Tax=Gluconobacter cerinus TaxID=38307 RepID=UPI00193F3173|nr:hypothetical protein [Gluconobacter cerinus]MBM3096883.1 hypothetical protein [Gluconobacter cerinus]